MRSADLLDHLQAAGLRVSLSADKVIVTPRAKLTDDLRRTIKANRAELVRALAPARLSRNGQFRRVDRGIYGPDRAILERY